MAYLQSRSNIARSGVTYAGWVKANPELKVNGTTRSVLHDGFEIQYTLDSPALFRFKVNPAVFTPNVGQSVTFAWTTPNCYWFTGTILRRSITLDADTGRLYTCEAVGDVWLLDRYAHVSRTYYNQGVNTILAHILANYTNGGFRVGYCPMTLGTIEEITFADEPVSDAISRLATAVDAHWFSHDRVISLFDTLPDGNAPSITNTNTVQIRDSVYDDDLSQVRTRVQVFGGGGRATAQTAFGSTSIPVDELSWYSFPCETVRIGANTVALTGTHYGTGPGNLLLLGNLPFDVPEGEFIQVYATAIDSTAQTDLATLLGGGLSGQATHVVENTRYTYTECVDVAAAELENYATTINGMVFTTNPAFPVHTTLDVGQILTINVTNVATISTTLRIQDVSIRPFEGHPIELPNPLYEKTVTARQLYRPLPLALRKD